MAKKMLIDATHPEETRVVVVDGQKVEDFDFESITKRQLAGNIYLAKVTRVEPSLQAAFIEYGGNRHGFLAFSEIHPDYYQIPVADREALLAEEEREEEERRAREERGETEDSKPAKSSRSRNRKSRGGKRKSSEETTVAGLEVIEVADSSESPAGLDIAEPDNEDPQQIDDGPLVSVDPVGSEPMDVIATDGDGASEVEEEIVLAEAGTSPDPAVDPDDSVEISADEGADVSPDVSETATSDGESAEEDPETPKTMAESAGLEDEDRVTEVVGDASSARTISAEASEPDQPALSEPEQADPVDDTAGTSEDPEVASAEPSVDEQAQASSGEQVSDTPPAESAAQADGVEAEETQEKPAKKPRRSRRSRSKKAEDAKEDQNAGYETSDEGDETETQEVEQVGAEDTLEEAARARTRLRRKYKIQDVIKVRQILLVQVVKEERGNKGAALTTYLSLAGRYCVLMPNTARGGGISRKITNASDRKRLREITSDMEVPKGMGLIVRTAGAERTKAEIKRDYEFLIRQWEQIREGTLSSIAPTLIYEEGSLIKRSIRDIYSKEIDQILVEGEQGYREAKEYMKMLMPSHAKNVQPYTDQIPLFSRYQVESYLNGMFNPTVQLKSGGYIVIGVTEALVAIDVNSGRATKQGSIEETALHTNLEAADEVARQLRLRDLAGLIVIDFIDMDENRNNRAVEKRMKERLKNDRARIQVSRISAFGLMEMSRQRLRPGMLEATTQPCPHCHGTGLIRSDENLSLSILREVEEECLRGRSDTVNVRAPVDVANYLINNKRAHIAQIEARHEVSISVHSVPTLLSPSYEIERTKSQTKAPAKPRAPQEVEEAEVLTETTDASEEQKSRRRRGKRGGRRKRGGDQTDGTEAQAETVVEPAGSETSNDAEMSEDGEKPKSRRGRGRRRGGRGRKDEGGTDQPVAEQSSTEGSDAEPRQAAASQADEATEVEAPTEAMTETVAETLAEPVAEAVAEAAPEPVQEATPAIETPDPESAPEPVIETKAAEPAPLDPEPALAEAEPAEAKPKRRGWWSFGG